MDLVIAARLWLEGYEPGAPIEDRMSRIGLARSALELCLDELLREAREARELERARREAAR